MPPKTRHESGSSLSDVVGLAESMSHSELPTLRAVLRHGMYLQEKCLMESDTERRNFAVKRLVSSIREEVVMLWSKANAQFKAPVIIANSSIDRKLEVAWTALGNVAWKRGGMIKEKDRAKFMDKLDFLFDIASCSHNILACSEMDCEGCKQGAHMPECSCRRECRIPQLELQFILSMRMHRPVSTKASMRMAEEDKAETKR